MSAIIGAKIKEYLDAKGIRYNFVAEKTGISNPAMSNILSGKRDVKLIEYYKICKAVDVPFETFLEQEVD